MFALQINTKKRFCGVLLSSETSFSNRFIGESILWINSLWVSEQSSHNLFNVIDIEIHLNMVLIGDLLPMKERTSWLYFHQINIKWFVFNKNTETAPIVHKPCDRSDNFAVLSHWTIRMRFERRNIFDLNIDRFHCWFGFHCLRLKRFDLRHARNFFPWHLSHIMTNL